MLLTFARRPVRERVLLAEAVVVLGLTSLAVAFLPFRWLAWAAKANNRSMLPVDELFACKLRRAVETAARVMPLRAMCIEQGLTAQIMLRRRGWHATLFYGAAIRPERGLVAHVWVRSGEVDVIGCGGADEFVLLAQFPKAGPDETAGVCCPHHV